ncbi:cytochrome-c peroxidase [Algivirga pacifica]|uniref:Cytochrome c peroxidase n=1 Tax=Algivirga pacifica TaxID=1162670 RepID=A0ABP9CZL9_9BACT
MRFILYAIFAVICIACTNGNFSNNQERKEHNPSTLAGEQLGARLFFDPALSVNGKVSCASCHQPQHGFADTVAFSKGVTGKSLLRHTPSLWNAKKQQALFWDGGARNLESAAFGPLRHVDEMGNQDLNLLLSRLKNKGDYPVLFKEAFGSDTITSAALVRALAQYQRIILPPKSRYDSVLQGTLVFSEVETKGKKLFERYCTSCHTTPDFTDYAYHNNGLDSQFSSDKEGVYQGRYRITLDSLDMGKFKTPSLIGVSKTAPYMHDGRFKTLNEVLEHYRYAIKKSKTLSPLLNNGIPLSDEEQQALKSFLETL